MLLRSSIRRLCTAPAGASVRATVTRLANGASGDLDADLPVLAKTYGCEEKAVGHFHQSQDSINATRRAARRAALEEAFPKDMPLWRKCCEHQGYEPGDVREVRVP